MWNYRPRANYNACWLAGTDLSTVWHLIGRCWCSSQAMLVAFTVGRTPMALTDLWAVLTGSANNTLQTVVWRIRAPRIAARWQPLVQRFQWQRFVSGIVSQSPGYRRHPWRVCGRASSGCSAGHLLLARYRWYQMAAFAGGLLAVGLSTAWGERAS
jgi:hypothetical protein